MKKTKHIGILSHSLDSTPLPNEGINRIIENIHSSQAPGSDLMKKFYKMQLGYQEHILRNTLPVLLLLIIIQTSCSPNTATPATVQNSVLPTAKILPTSTHASTPIPSETIIPTISETPSPTAIWAYQTLMSPNGELVANAYIDFHPSGKQTIEIRNKDGELVWQIPYQGEMPTGDPSPLLSIFQWSKDSSQLYFYYDRPTDGGDGGFWWTGYNLQKFDVRTGSTRHVLPGNGFMSFAISLDRTQIAYTRQQDQPSIIYIRNLSTGLEKAAHVILGSKNYDMVGDIHWSPTGKELAFQTETEDFMVETIYLNIATMEQRVIREYKVSSLVFQGWTSDGKLEFMEFEKTGVQIIRVDVNNNETVVIGTPTPTP
jgi:hypothetical protein